MSESEINIGFSNKDLIKQNEEASVNANNTTEQEISIGLNQNENTEELDKKDSNIDKEEDISNSKEKTEDNWPNNNQKINSKYNVEENGRN